MIESGRLRVAAIALEWPSFGRETGGEGRYARRLCAQLADHVELTVVTGPDPVPVRGVKLVPVAVSHADRFDRFYRAPFRAAEAVRGLAPDVVHAHQDDWPLALDPRWKVPIVRTYHGRKLAEARTSRFVRRMNHYVLAVLETTCRSHYKLAVGVGTESVSAFKCDHLIPPVLAGERPSPAKKTSEPLAVFIGAFGTRKRGALALRAAIQARQVLPDLRLTVVGPEGDRLRYPPWVEFHVTPDEDDDVQALIAEAWVLLAPSAYEGFGIPAWEAMMAGTAVVATANPGIEYLTAGTGCCTVVEPEHLGGALVQLVESELAREAQVRRALARALEVAELGRPERYVSLFRSVAT